MNDSFGIGWMKDGLYIEWIYWVTNNRYFKKDYKGGSEGRTRRISKKEYFEVLEDAEKGKYIS